MLSYLIDEEKKPNKNEIQLEGNKNLLYPSSFRCTLFPMRYYALFGRCVQVILFLHLYYVWFLSVSL